MLELPDAAIARHLAVAVATIAVVLGGLAVALRAAGGRTFRSDVRVARRGGLALGGGAAVHVLQIDRTTLVVGSSAGGVSLLCRLEPEGPQSPVA